LAVLREAWVAVTGADASANVPTWRPVRVAPGEVLEFPRSRSGTWTYLAVAGGIAAPRLLGSASAYPRGRLGRLLASEDLVWRAAESGFVLPAGVAGQVPPSLERRNYDAPPPLRVWPGPQLELFGREDRARFVEEPWTVSSRSDRVGYRLEGVPMGGGLPQRISEPMRVGTVQVPESGILMVMLRDGPTVGGYPKLAVVDPSDISWLAQCRPGQRVRFQPMEGSGACGWT
jgi:antagonist of KipI